MSNTQRNPKSRKRFRILLGIQDSQHNCHCMWRHQRLWAQWCRISSNVGNKARMGLWALVLTSTFRLSRSDMFCLILWGFRPLALECCSRATSCLVRLSPSIARCRAGLKVPWFETWLSRRPRQNCGGSSENPVEFLPEFCSSIITTT